MIETAAGDKTPHRHRQTGLEMGGKKASKAENEKRDSKRERQSAPIQRNDMADEAPPPGTPADGDASTRRS